MQRTFSIALPVFFALSGASAQTAPDTVRPVPTTELERSLEQATQDAEDSQLVDMFAELLEHPVDLNSASLEELTQVPGLTPMIAFSIISRREHRAFRSVDELLVVDSITDDLLERVRPFVTVDIPGRARWSAPLKSIALRSRATRDLQDRKGFLDGSYEGSPIKLLNRFTARSGNLGNSSSFVDIGLLTEKDAGERSFASFVAGYVSLDLPDDRTKIIVGDYSVETGEGLVFWRPLGISKGSDVISAVKRSAVGIRPYLSTDENWYFHGIATQVRLGGFTVSGMYSSKPMDVSVNSEDAITSFVSDGLFRTASELKRLSGAHSESFGASVAMSVADGFTIGGSGYRTIFDHEVSESGIFGLHGNRTSMLGLNLGWTQSSYAFSSEIARSNTGSLAAIARCMCTPVKNVEVSVLGRFYPKDFVGLYGNGFGESGSTQNESGIYFGTRLRFSPRLNVSAYYDQFVFPWSSGSIPLPSSGHDLLLVGEFTFSQELSAQLQFKTKSKPAEETLLDQYGRDQRIVGERRQANYRVTLEFNPSTRWRSRSRIELVNIEHSNSPVVGNGVLLFQDIRYSPSSLFLLDTRVIAFQSDSFDSRVYEYETDFLGTFSNPGLFGKGVRWYLMGKLQISTSVNCWLKYSQTIKEGLKVIGSGTSLIQGDLESRISLQLDIVY